MIGDDPYTLGLFDTAGKYQLKSFPLSDVYSRGLCSFTVVISRSGGLRQAQAFIVPTNGRLLGLLQCHIPGFI